MTAHRLVAQAVLSVTTWLFSLAPGSATIVTAGKVAVGAGVQLWQHIADTFRRGASSTALSTWAFLFTFPRRSTPKHAVSSSHRFCPPRPVRLTTDNGKLADAINVAAKALDGLLTPPFSKLAVAFNGGKDSVAVVRILQYVIAQKLDPTATTAAKVDAMAGEISDFMKSYCVFFTFDDPDEFPEMVEFRRSFCATVLRGVPLREMKGASLKQVVQELFNEGNVHAAILGVRGTDGKHQTKAIEPTTNGWARIMRFAPAFDWTTVNVWALLKGDGVPYCSLYDEGYSSLGKKSQSMKDSKLQRPDGSYAAAWEAPQLLDRQGSRL